MKSPGGTLLQAADDQRQNGLRRWPDQNLSLRGIKDSPPYLLTLEDTVEFFNLVVALKLTELEKKDLVAFLRVL